jgi:F0F1-type ATP synthase membrane subunit c/vacuolar-type H+-ATPase subunit K
MLDNRRFKKMDIFAWLVILLFILALAIAFILVNGYS